MLAIARALVTNPHLLIMDEPTEGLAPVIVAQVEEMLVRLGEESDMAILVIEQNIGVATVGLRERRDHGQRPRSTASSSRARLAADRDLQQRLLGVGRHSDADAEAEAPEADARAAAARPPRRDAPARRPESTSPIPSPPTRWSQPVPIARIEAGARTASVGVTGLEEAARARATPTLGAQSGPPAVLVVGTLDTKGAGAALHPRPRSPAAACATRLVDVSTSGKLATCDVTAQEVALNHGRGGAAVFGRDRGASVDGDGRGLRRLDPPPGRRRRRSSAPAGRAAPRSSRRACARCRSACPS